MPTSLLKDKVDWVCHGGEGGGRKADYGHDLSQQFVPRVSAHKGTLNKLNVFVVS